METLIDRRHNYGIILDTETTNTLTSEEGKLDMRYVLPYDISFAVIDTKGRMYESYAFVNKDIFENEPELMASAYYADKIEQYIKDISDGVKTLANTYEIRKTFNDVCKKYGCYFMVAHNARFDVQALNNIVKWTTKSKYRYFLPNYVEVWDTMKMANSVICKMPTYKKFCEENGYLTKNGQLRKTAEILYRFITGDNDFKEEHKGFEDILIEIEIFKYCIRQKKAMNKILYEAPCVVFC